MNDDDAIVLIKVITPLGLVLTPILGIFATYAFYRDGGFSTYRDLNWYIFLMIASIGGFFFFIWTAKRFLGWFSSKK